MTTLDEFKAAIRHAAIERIGNTPMINLELQQRLNDMKARLEVVARLEEWMQSSARALQFGTNKINGDRSAAHIAISGIRLDDFLLAAIDAAIRDESEQVHAAIDRMGNHIADAGKMVQP